MISPMRLNAGVLTVVLFLGGGGFQTPVFRSRVDLVTVDVAVVDESGRQVTGLTAQEFAIVADRRARRVVSADYISARSQRTVSTGLGDVPPPAPTSNSLPT